MLETMQHQFTLENTKSHHNPHNSTIILSEHNHNIPAIEIQSEFIQSI